MCQEEDCQRILQALFDSWQVNRSIMVRKMKATIKRVDKQLTESKKLQAQSTEKLKQKQAERQQLSREVYESLERQFITEEQNEILEEAIEKKKEQVVNCTDLQPDDMETIGMEMEMQLYFNKKEKIQKRIHNELRITMGGR